jgi:hypothetical protein
MATSNKYSEQLVVVPCYGAAIRHPHGEGSGGVAHGVLNVLKHLRLEVRPIILAATVIDKLEESAVRH